MSKTGIAFWALVIGFIAFCNISLYRKMRAAEPFHANWNGKVWSCPAGTDTWVDENEALKDSQDFVYCIPQSARERQGLDEDQVR